MGGQFFVAKYTYEIKKQVVQAYLNNEGGHRYIAQKYNISTKNLVKMWVKAYEAYGDDGLVRSRENKIYTFEFKLSVVELYLTTEVSYQDLALSVGMTNPFLISKWVNDYRIVGPDALRQKRKGRQLEMNKSTTNKSHIVSTANDNTAYIKQLEDELLKLKIENAYLKEVRRLRLEGTPLNKKRESSTVSEDHSN